MIIAIDSPDAIGIAEELGQRLLGKHVVETGFHLTSYESYASLDFPNAETETLGRIETEILDWIRWKHPALKMRKLSGTRQKQNLGMPTESKEEIAFIEIRK